ncbi:MAG: M48 family metalloprotease [Verrucomicrobia bacterium]|nr:M48 family metalloprotease [Verrucomicrobiota bacterium]
MINLRILIPVFFSSLLIQLNASEHEPSLFPAIDPATEVRLGRPQRDEALKKYYLSTNQMYIDTVNRIGRKIANTLSYERPDLIDHWGFTVVGTSDDDVNCFCLGGGQVMVSEGFLDRIEKANGGVIDEDMLASVLGHEMAHDVCRHILMGASTQGSMQWILNHLTDIEKGSDGYLTAEATARLEELARARFTRDQELEADLLGALYATRAGFDGFEGALRYLRVAANDPREEYWTSGGLLAYDPAWKERIAKLESFREAVANLAGEFNWGHYLLETYDFKKASKCFEDLTKAFPDSFEAWNNLGISYHWQYLQATGKSEKFQPGLIDYFVPMRNEVRGESPLNKAIRAYQRALQINAHAVGTQSNLALALIETHEPENLETAEVMLRKLLEPDPDSPIYLNDLAILTYWKTRGNSGATVNQNAAEDLFGKAAASGYLPAKYNLAVLQLEMGKTKDGVTGLQEYLKKDSFSPWAKLAMELVKELSLNSATFRPLSRA